MTIGTHSWSFVAYIPLRFAKYFSIIKEIKTVTILVPIDGHMMSNVYLTRCYGSCERVHVIIKHEHHNEIYPLAFLLR